MIDCVVDTEVAVMNTVELLHVDGLVLGVMFINVERQLLPDLPGVDGGGYLGVTLVEHRQNGIINIIVEKHNALIRRANQVGYFIF